MIDPAAASDIGQHLEQFAVSIILGLNLWLIRTVQQMRDDVREFANWAFGVRNGGGAREQIVAIEKRLDSHHDRLTQLEPRERRHPPLGEKNAD